MLKEHENHAIELIIKEYQRACRKFPEWPIDPIHASGVLVEEAGELMQACLDYVYCDDHFSKAVDEAVQCGAMALRFLVHVGQYTKSKSEQV